MKNKCSILQIVLISLLPLKNVSGQINKENPCDTIWIQNGIEYDYNPLKTIKEKDFSFLTIKRSNYRTLVDSIGVSAKYTFNRKKLSEEILKNDSLFNSNWSSESTFPSLEPIKENDSVNIILIQGNETFFYNSWGSFNSKYGPRWGRMHRGIDLGLNIGDTLRSSFNGIVRYAEFNTGGYGNCVIIRHFNGLETLYAHLEKILVTPGQLVYAADVIGLGGTTGRSDGPHLHFETRYKGRSFNPLKIFDKDSLNLHSNFLVIRKKDITDPYIPKKKYHVVRSGQTLSYIAAKYRTTISRIQKLNGIRNRDKIYIGQRIRVK
ncbi:MAG: hypothetical protein CL844_10125 [Crocinitomicaceae bacterium]|nr:hypothetical protein [Crocinitomicaceae bacterium]|tara:strand:+ start:6323 stop:7285 length:963 start_codon:yes stop_codon:yes gene_type:complete